MIRRLLERRGGWPQPCHHMVRGSLSRRLSSQMEAPRISGLSPDNSTQREIYRGLFLDTVRGHVSP